MQTCLLVDDSSAIRKAIRAIIEKLKSYDVIEAENGLAAYEACQKSMPDLIILDWNMPVMTGIEFLEKLRATPGGDKPAVIMCTTNNELQHIQKAIELGANEYVMKPFDLEILRAKLQMLGILPQEG